MIIDLKSIPGEGVKKYEFNLERNWWIPEYSNDRIGGIDSPVEVRIEIYRVGKKYVLKGFLEGSLQVVCDRCLNSYSQIIKSEFNSFLIPAPADSENAELELMEDDMEVNFINDDEIDLHDIVREQMYLSLPIKSLCKDKCLGLCTKCGSNLNKHSCECVKEQGHPGFSVLNKLKN